MHSYEALRPWDVWLANVKFEDCLDSKLRPVLIIEDKQIYVLSLKMTSHPPRPEFAGEYRLKRWREAGLLKPTVVRCSKWLQLSGQDFHRRLGTLHIEDIIAIRNIIRISK